MVKDSLLDAYRKLNLLRRKFNEGNYRDKLKKRLDFYKQEGMTAEYAEVLSALQTYENLNHSLDTVFDGPNSSDSGRKFTWQDYFKGADQLLYGEKYPEYVDPNYYGTNDKLLEVAVRELNKHYPSDKWQLGDLPLYRWDILNAPGYETTEEDIEEWKNNPNVVESDGYYIENSVRYVKCIHSAGAKSILEHSKDDMAKLRNACSALRAAREAYVVEDSVLMDRECSGGYDLGLELVFRENATTTFYGTELTPVEKVINFAIVSEIDTRLAGTEAMGFVHCRLNVINELFNNFLVKNNFKPAPVEATPSSEEENSFIK